MMAISIYLLGKMSVGIFDSVDSFTIIAMLLKSFIELTSKAPIFLAKSIDPK